MSVKDKLKVLQDGLHAGVLSKDKYGVPMLQFGTQERVIYFADSKKYRVLSHTDFHSEEELVNFLKKAITYK